MFKRFISVFLTLVLVLLLIPVAAPDAAMAFTPVTGMGMMEKLGIGINIGNTLEARPWANETQLGNHMDTESHWGVPKIEPWHFKAIRQKGFDSVRIPVSWEPHMDRNYNIYKEWMDRVQQCVDWALAEGLYVIINTHHERSSPQSLYELIDNGNMTEAEKYLTAIWRQVAERFKDYSEKLIFEPMNEPYRAVKGGWIWGPGHVLDRELCEKVNRLNNVALDLIRKSGGNNARRVVVLTVPGAQSDAVPFYDHPDDAYTMLGVFYYDRHDFRPFQPALDKGIPMFIKEISPMDAGNNSPPREGVLAWTQDYFGRFAKMGMPTFWWNCRGTGPEEIFDRATGAWNATLVNALFRAYGRTPGSDFIDIPPPVFPYELPGPYNDRAFTYWNPPVRQLVAAEKMVVEHTGTFTGGYMFSRNYPAPWQQFADGDSRITVEPGKIIFDMRGLEGNQHGFATWTAGDNAKITRVYLDIYSDKGVDTSGSTLDNFTKIKTYTPGTFTDVSNQWFADLVGNAYEYGIIEGDGNRFNPGGILTGGEALAIGARIHAVYKYGSGGEAKINTFERPGNRWFDKYVLYAKAEGLIGSELDAKMSTPVTRAEMVFAWSKILSSNDMTTRNTVNGLPDVTANTQYRDAILLFYRAGLVTGSDERGTFNPSRTITRAEAAAIFIRLVDVEARSSGKVFG